MNFFNGHDETVHLERGQSFGIPPPIYRRKVDLSVGTKAVVVQTPRIVAKTSA
jgi:hypothetical protein